MENVLSLCNFIISHSIRRDKHVRKQTNIFGTIPSKLEMYLHCDEKENETAANRNIYHAVAIKGNYFSQQLLLTIRNKEQNSIAVLSVTFNVLTAPLVWSCICISHNEICTNLSKSCYGWFDSLDPGHSRFTVGRQQPIQQSTNVTCFTIQFFSPLWHWLFHTTEKVNTFAVFCWKMKVTGRHAVTSSSEHQPELGSSQALAPGLQITFSILCTFLNVYSFKEFMFLAVWICRPAVCFSPRTSPGTVPQSTDLLQYWLTCCWQAWFGIPVMQASIFVDKAKNGEKYLRWWAGTFYLLK